MQPQFKLLGPFQVLVDGRPCTSFPPRARSVFALLVLRANRIVIMDSFIEELWGTRPPKNAVATVQTYIYNLRRMFATQPPGPRGAAGAALIETKSPGYLLRVPPEQIDVTDFVTLLRRGTSLLGAARYAEAVLELRAAADLWTGPAFADVPRGILLTAHAAQLEEQRSTAIASRIKADVALGKHAELIAELRSLVCADPLNEWLHEQLITSLSRAGRRGEALKAYQDVRTLLDEELGVDPSPALQRLQLEILSLGAPQPGRVASVNPRLRLSRGSSVGSGRP